MPIKKGKQLIWSLLSGVLGLYMASLFRNRRAIQQRRMQLCRLISEGMNIQFEANEITLSISGMVKMKGISLTKSKNISVSVGVFMMRISWWQLLKRRIVLRSLHIDEVMCSLLPATKTNAGPSQANSSNGQAGPRFKKYYRLGFRCLRYLFRYWPAECSLNHISLLFQVKNKALAVKLVSFQCNKGQWQAAISPSLTGRGIYQLKGSIDHTNNTLAIEELITPRHHFQAGADEGEKLDIRLNRKGPWAADFHIAVANCTVQSKRLSVKPVVIERFEAHFFCSLNAHSLLLEKSSYIQWNKLSCHFQLHHLFTDDSIRLNLRIPSTRPADFLKSFPDFACKEIYAIEYEGKLGYDMNLLLSLKNPTQYLVKAQLIREQFSVNRQEGSLFESLHHAFIHTVYEDNKLQKMIDMTAGKCGFTAIHEVPVYLTKIFVETEDQTFFSHHGVDPFFMVEAMIQNLKKARIQRGGSTITMQLVRNLFLGHNRNMYRKIEEIVIAWLLEEGYGLSKERIMELYLNIIEFAPGVYGIEDGSRYYFGKPPLELSITECMVLSYVLPRPKHFAEALDICSEQLNRNLLRHLQTVGDNLFARGVISRNELNNINFNIPIRDRVLHLS